MNKQSKNGLINGFVYGKGAGPATVFFAQEAEATVLKSLLPRGFEVVIQKAVSADDKPAARAKKPAPAKPRARKAAPAKKPAASKKVVTKPRRTPEEIADLATAALIVLKSEGKASIGTIAKALKVERSTLSSPLAKLIEDGAIEQQGNRRSAVYVPRTANGVSHS